MTERAGKYARFELERRFLVSELPSAIDQNPGWRITDRYIKHTHLRLRRMEPIHAGETVFKFGQKQVPSAPDFSRMIITNIYLSESEYGVLAGLEARELRKIRRTVDDDGGKFSVDVFVGPLAGLILAEVGFETAEGMRQPFNAPAWISREVSHDIRFTGGALAALNADEAAELLRQISC